jgi:hypothetical protein
MKVVLCTQGFTKDYIQQIRQLIPESFRVTETTLPSSHAMKGPQFLCVIFGSRQTQAMRAVKIQFCNARYNSFIISLERLHVFLLSATKCPGQQPSSSLQPPFSAEQEPHQPSYDQ